LRLPCGSSASRWASRAFGGSCPGTSWSSGEFPAGVAAAASLRGR
jgi:hypothetical protein